MDEARDLPIGRIRGLRACASARGTFGVLALDHRQNLRRELRPTDPDSVGQEEMVAFKRAVVRELGSAATGVLLDPEIGAAQSIVDGSLPAGCGLLVAIEATGYDGPSTARVSRVLDGWSVAKAKRLGASAAKLLVYYHPEATNAADQERLVAGVAATAPRRTCRCSSNRCRSRSAGRPTARGRGAPEGRRGDGQTPDPPWRRLLKAEFPYDPEVTDEGRWREACAELDEASRLPWVLLSGGVDDATFEAQVRVACDAGASGVLVGRSVWAEAATLAPAARAAFLRSTGRLRLGRLVDLVDELGRPWDARPGPLVPTPEPGSGWYRGYAG